MDIVFYIAIMILFTSITFLMRRHGWVVLWNGFFIFILLFVLVLAQKHIGNIEGLLIAVGPFVAGQMLIRKNRKVNVFYFAKQTKFINWCNNNIYHIVYTENYPQEKSARAKRRKNENR
ncbi:hypothetical protein [Sulfurovum sp. AR]|uniref:hypothetical protein n=1 Tax=Sulfurovum sp. AR TaxID=1165841 RepID=UPI00025C4ABF|nr:hypothetical protein [Sulfurovum sp. AR]EIF50247.1 hypothetical protein SULAR_09244 [Sulfurovum sp. AR]